MGRRLLALFRRGRLDRELDTEVRFHLEMLEAEFRGRGLTGEEARLAARREFGAVEPMKERYRDRRGLRWLEDLVQDLRYGARALGRSPGFALTVVLSLALAIGANAAVFAVFDALLLKMLPVRHPEELVTLYRTGGWGRGFLSYPLYDNLRTQADVFSGVLARSMVYPARWGTGPARFLEREYVSGNYFHVLGIRAAAGRLLGAQDTNTPGESAVAVLGYDAWKTRFGLDPHVIGRTIVLDEQPFTVVGVAQPGFRGIELERPAEIWVPLTMNPTPLDQPGAHWLWVVARRKPGLPDSKIRAEASTIMARYLAANYGSKPTSGFKRVAMEQRLEVRPGGIGISLMRAEFATPVRLLMGAVVLVLLTACANVASLLLARGAARRRDTALRLSLGASRGRLVRQWLAESGLLAGAGAGFGFLLADWAGRLLAGLIPGLFDTDALPVDTGGPLMIFVAATALLSAVAFGVVAGLGSTDVDPATGLREGSSRGRVRLAVRRSLVVAQVAFSVVLVVTAGLFARSLAGLRALNIGFGNYDVLTFNVMTPRSYTTADHESLPPRVLDRISAVPGVVSASGGFPGPYQAGDAFGDLFVPGFAKASHPAEVALQYICPRYFETLGSPLASGREFDVHDGLKSRRVAVVNQAFADRYFGGRDPVGRLIGLNADGPADVTVVGLARNIRHEGVRTPAVPLVYVPRAQQPSASMVQFLVRSNIPDADLLRVLRREIAVLDPGLAVTGAQTLGQRIDRSLFQDRMLALLSMAFSALTLVLAAVGLYGVVAFIVTRRTAEIGVRLALGASPAGILWMVVREALLLVAIGVAAGVPAAVAAARLARTLLFGVRPYDPAVLSLSLAVLLLAGLAAAFVPARRATRVDPVAALRME